MRLAFALRFLSGLVTAVLLLVAPAVGAMKTKAAVVGAPEANAASFVTVQTANPADPGGLTVLTEAVAIKETGPKETVARFGEVYTFSPAFLAVRLGEPTLLRLWGLQPDDEHDFALFDPRGGLLLHTALHPLQAVAYRLTFHRKGLYVFRCLLHQPEMTGQILVTDAEPR